MVTAAMIEETNDWILSRLPNAGLSDEVTRVVTATLSMGSTNRGCQSVAIDRLFWTYGLSRPKAEVVAETTARLLYVYDNDFKRPNDGLLGRGEGLVLMALAPFDVATIAALTDETANVLAKFVELYVDTLMPMKVLAILAAETGTAPLEIDGLRDRLKALSGSQHIQDY